MRYEAGNAFPLVWYPGQEGQAVQGGLTKRELYAAIALQGLAARSITSADPERTRAVQAVNMADELIRALNEIQP